MEFKDYVYQKLNEEDVAPDSSFSNAADVMTNFEEIVTRLADVFSAMSVKGSLNANGDVGRALIDIRKKVNIANDASKSKDKVFTEDEKKAMRIIADNLRDIIEVKVTKLSKTIAERLKKEQEKAAKEAEKNAPPETEEEIA